MVVLLFNIFIYIYFFLICSEVIDVNTFFNIEKDGSGNIVGAELVSTAFLFNEDELSKQTDEW